jgi:hypothetical protein
LPGQGRAVGQLEFVAAVHADKSDVCWSTVLNHAHIRVGLGGVPSQKESARDKNSRRKDHDQYFVHGAI